MMRSHFEIVIGLLMRRQNSIAIHFNTVKSVELLPSNVKVVGIGSNAIIHKPE